MNNDNKNTELNDIDKKLHISDVMRLLCNKNMYNKSELHSAEIGDDGELCMDSIKETSFQIGFMCARKFILDALKQ
jgi:hypothetical protein